MRDGAGEGGALKVLLADDHALFRGGMRYLLSEFDRDVQASEASSFAEAVSVLNQQDFDLIFIDLVMPGMDQMQGIQSLRELRPTTPIIVVSMLDSAEDIRRAINAGAIGFIPKSSSPEVMLKAIELILSGGTYLPPAVLGPGADGHADRVEQPTLTTDAKLTPRQTTVLEKLALGKSNKEIANELHLSEVTVKVHIGAIMRALNVRNRTQAVLAAVRHGLIPEIERKGFE
jgi:DNA-binding NarL/FixJ family response regulator